jgi:hypothetical protein
MPGLDCHLRQFLLHCLGYAKIDNSGHRNAIVQRNQDIGRFNIPVNNPLLVGMLDSVADFDEKVEAVMS